MKRLLRALAAGAVPVALAWLGGFNFERGLPTFYIAVWVLFTFWAVWKWPE